MNQNEIETMAKETGDNGDKPTSAMKGEVSWADPSRLFTGSEKIQQYNPSLLITRKGYQIIDKMRKDDQVKVSMTFKKHSVFSTGYDIIAPDGAPKDWEPKEFIEKCFEQMKGSLYKSLLQALTALDYGFSVSELVYENGDIGFGKQVLLKEIKTRKPHSFEFLADEYGNLKTIKQYQLSGGWTLAGEGKEMPVEKFVVFVNDMEWGNWYGQSDLESAYRPWWIKDNSYKWYSMLLERRGIPPIFALYDPNQFQAGLVDSLKEVMESIQAATTGVIPRATPQGLEFWSPQLAKEASDVFQKAIDMFNRDIARSILMPGLLGFTPDQAEGSYARSKVHFDVFLMVVEFLRGRIEDEVIQEQIIVPLCDYNYPNLEEYPQFKFKPITEEVRLDLMDRWITAVEKGVVVTQLDDEAHIRTVLQFPEKVGNEVAPGPNPKEPEVEEVVVEEPVEDEEEIKLAKGNWGHVGRPGSVGGSGGGSISIDPSVGSKEKTKLEQVLKYFTSKDIPSDIIVQTANLGRVYGRSKGNRVIIDTTAMKEEHPAFIAGIIKHESTHSFQDKSWTPEKKEFDARFKTKMWASLKFKKDSPIEEQEAFQKVIRLSTTGVR